MVNKVLGDFLNDYKPTTMPSGWFYTYSNQDANYYDINGVQTPTESGNPMVYPGQYADTWGIATHTYLIIGPGWMHPWTLRPGIAYTIPTGVSGKIKVTGYVQCVGAGSVRWWFRHDSIVIDWNTTSGSTVYNVDEVITVASGNTVQAWVDYVGDPSGDTTSINLHIEALTPFNTVKPTLTINDSGFTGTVGTWDNQDNGTISYQWELRDADNSSVVASGTGSAISGSGGYSGEYYLWVRASNDGGYNVNQDSISSIQAASFTSPTFRVFSGRKITKKPNDLRDGLVGAWCPSLDKSRSDIVTDLSGYNNHATMAFMTPATNRVVSDGKMALYFDGSLSQYIFPETFKFTVTKPITISFWNYVVSPSVSAAFGQSSTTSNPTSRLNCHAPWSDGNIYWDCGSYLTARVVTDYTPYLGKWTHITCQSTVGENTFQGLWLDGKLAVSRASSEAPPNATDDLGIGVWYNNPTVYAHTGSIDDFRVYDRILTPSEIQLLASQRGIGLEKPKRSRHVVVNGASFNPPIKTLHRRTKKNTSLRDGLVGAWCPSLDKSRSDRLTDLSGYNNHGTLTNMNPATDWVASEGKMALDFDGSDGRCQLIEGILPNNSPLSISGWFNPDVVVGSDRGMVSIWDARDSGLRAGAFNSNYITFYLDGVGYIETGYTWVLGKWVHIAGTWDGSSLILYINNLLYAQTAATGGYTISGNGAIGKNASFYWDGKIDDVRIYNRALTPSEIALLATRRGIGLEPPQRKRRAIVTGITFPKVIKGSTRVANKHSNLQHGLIGAWCPSLDKSRSDRLTDLSGYNNHGTLKNMEPGNDWVVKDGKTILDLDGVNDYVEFSKPTISGMMDHSVSLWVNLRDVNEYETLVSNGKWGETGFNFYYSNYSAESLVLITGYNLWYADLATSLVENKWTHFAFTKRGMTCKMYCNGKELSVTEDFSALEEGDRLGDDYGVPTRNLQIANDIDETYPSGPYTNAQFDDIRVYDRVLTNTEIELLAFKQGIGLEPPKRRRRSVTIDVTPTVKIRASGRNIYDHGSLRNGLVSAWCPSLDKSRSHILTDFSGYNRNGILDSAVPPPSANNAWQAGDGNMAFKTSPDGQYYYKTGTQDYGDIVTISYWIKVLSVTFDMIWIYKSGRFALGASSIFFSPPLYRLDWSYGGIQYTIEGDYIPYGVWHHQTFIANKTWTELWINGKYKTSGSSTGYLTTNTASDVVIGGTGPIGIYSDSFLDDIKIYDRVLTPSEIQLLSTRRGIGLEPPQRKRRPAIILPKTTYDKSKNISLGTGF